MASKFKAILRHSTITISPRSNSEKRIKGLPINGSYYVQEHRLTESTICRSPSGIGINSIGSRSRYLHNGFSRSFLFLEFFFSQTIFLRAQSSVKFFLSQFKLLSKQISFMFEIFVKLSHILVSGDGLPLTHHF